MIALLSYRLSEAKVTGPGQPDLGALRPDVPQLRSRTLGTPRFSHRAGALTPSPKSNNLRRAGTDRVSLEEAGVQTTMERTDWWRAWNTV